MERPSTPDDLTPISLEEEQEPLRRPQPKRWGRRLGLLLAFLLLIGGAIYWFNPGGWLLQMALVDADERIETDVLLIDSLGQAKQAAAMYHDRWAGQILITQGPPPRYVGEDPRLSKHYYIQESLVNEYYVPRAAIASYPRDATSRLDEMQMRRDWMLAEGVSSYTQFASPYHSRFTRMQHEDTFDGLGIRAVILIQERGATIWRKEMLNIKDTLVRMLFWWQVYGPIAREEAQALRQPLAQASQTEHRNMDARENLVQHEWARFAHNQQ